MNALVFDLGTTYFKAGVFGPSLDLIAFERVATPISRSDSTLSEMSADHFANAIQQLSANLRRKAAGQWQQITRLSFASQANSFVLLDERRIPLTPIILWNDRRAQKLPDLQAQLDRLHPHDAAARTGVPRVDEQFLPAKLLWIRQNQPTLWSRAAHVFTISDYLTHLLTGRHVIEASLAGLTGLADIHQPGWRDVAIDALGIPVGRFPEIVRAGTLIGPLTGSAGPSLGLVASCQMVAGCLDQFAGAIGAGATLRGVLTETTGTVLATVAPADHFDAALADAGIFQGPSAVAGRYFRLCFGDISGAVLEAYRNQLPDRPDFADLDRSAAEGDLPASIRLDTAHWLTHRQIRFTGDQSPSRPQAVRAIQLAVADALAEQVRRIAPQADRVHAAGGAAQSQRWIDLKSRTLGIPVIAAAAEPTLRGAAVIALADSGRTP